MKASAGPPKPYALDRYGLTVHLPSTWKVSPGQTSSASDGVLLEIESDSKFEGRLHWATGGMSLETATEVLFAGWKTKFREVDLRKKEAWLGNGVRLEVRISNDAPSTLVMTCGFVFHRGRIYNLMFWSHQGDWHEYSSEVHAIYKSLTLSAAPGETYALGAKPEPQVVRSKKYSYELELPPEWSFEESGPEETVVVSRMWTESGFPAAHVMAIRNPDKPDLSFVDHFLAQMPKEQKLEVLEKKQTGEVVLARFANTMGPVRYQSLIMTIKQGTTTLCLQAWCKSDEYSSFEKVFSGMADSFRLLK